MTFLIGLQLMEVGGRGTEKKREFNSGQAWVSPEHMRKFEMEDILYVLMLKHHVQELAR